MEVRFRKAPLPTPLADLTFKGLFHAVRTDDRVLLKRWATSMCECQPGNETHPQWPFNIHHGWLKSQSQQAARVMRHTGTEVQLRGDDITTRAHVAMALQAQSDTCTWILGRAQGRRCILQLKENGFNPGAMLLQFKGGHTLQVQAETAPEAWEDESGFEAQAVLNGLAARTPEQVVHASNSDKNPGKLEAAKQAHKRKVGTHNFVHKGKARTRQRHRNKHDLWPIPNQGKQKRPGGEGLYRHPHRTGGKPRRWRDEHFRWRTTRNSHMG